MVREIPLTGIHVNKDFEGFAFSCFTWVQNYSASAKGVHPGFAASCFAWVQNSIKMSLELHSVFKYLYFAWVQKLKVRSRLNSPANHVCHRESKKEICYNVSVK